MGISAADTSGYIESGKSGTIDALTKASAVSQTAGDKNTLIVTYEDKAGNIYTEEMELSISVNQPVYENLEKVKDTTNISGVVRQIAVILIVIAVVVFIIVLSYKRWKRKQKLLEDM